MTIFVSRTAVFMRRLLKAENFIVPKIKCVN